MAVVVNPKGRNTWMTTEVNETSRAPSFDCSEADVSSAIILISLGALGIGANLALMSVILLRKPLRR